MRFLGFDSHNHVHMGPNPPLWVFLPSTLIASVQQTDNHNDYCTASTASLPTSHSLSGMAIMSTHPRDFQHVLELSILLPKQVPGVKIVPCFGVHPWFLHELSEQDWKISNVRSLQPAWLDDMEDLLLANPQAVVGEIGLDGFHFDGTTKELVSSIDKQQEAFRLQLELASRLKRPVSIHCVQSFGPLMQTLAKVKKTHSLPPKVYFHAFGGKVGTVDQLVALCEKGREKSQIYFGFAAIVNSRSPKTPALIRKVSLERLVLESDHEDAALVSESLEQSIRIISDALDEAENVIIEQTTRNACDLYNLDKDPFV